jgi:hypothetical protein
MKMLEKYRATIYGNKIEWDDEVPEGLQKNRTLNVEVTPIVASKRRKRANAKKMIEALEAIAAMGGVKSIPDASKWQREIRKDRRLPGRD